MRTTLCFLLLMLASNFCFAQQSDEATLRKLENSEREAILKSDTVTLTKLMSPRVVVQNPENAIVKFSQIMGRVKSGKINYASFDRVIEHISIIENIAIVMGEEIIVPQGVTANAGKTVTRRFTNIWMRDKEDWRLTARQATIVSVK